MNKKLVALMAVLIMTISVASYSFASYYWETTGNNLIYNPDLTNSVGSWYQQLVGIFVHVPDEGHNAPGCGLVTGRTAINQQVYQPLSLEEDVTYVASAWVKLKNPEDEEKGTITLVTSNAVIINEYPRSVSASASEWKELCVTIVADNPQKKVNVGLANFTDVNIEFYIDDVSVKKVDTSKLYPASITLNGATAAVVPKNGVNEVRLRCSALNQYGGSEGMHDIGDSLRWYVEGEYDGVWVNKNGVLQVETVANPGKIKVIAEADSPNGKITASREIEILPAVEFSDEGNLFCNGNFENIGMGEWQGDNLKVLSEKAYDGEFAAFMPNGGSAGQAIYLKPGKKYLITAMVNVYDVDNEFYFSTDNPDISVVGKNLSASDNEWHRAFSVLDTEKLNENAKVIVSIISKNPSEYYTDSFFVAEMREEFGEFNAEFTYTYNEKEEANLKNGELLVRAKLSNGTGIKNVIVAAALYNSDNSVEDISITSGISLNEFETKTVALDKKFNITDCTNQSVKLFVWKNNFTPDKNIRKLNCSDEIVMHIYKNKVPDSEKNIFSTIAGATAKINQLKNSNIPYPKDGITIILHEGIYQNERMLFLDENWRKEGDRPLKIKAADGENVLITGDKNIEGAAFMPANDAEKARLVVPEAREHLVKIDLKAQGIKDFGTLSLPGTYQLDVFKTIPTMPELIINGKVMNIARYPNHGYMLVTKVINSGADAESWTDEEKKNPTDEMLKDGFIIAPEDERFKNWTNAKDAVMYGYWHLTWVDQAIPIAEINTGEGTITGKYPTTRGIKDNGYFYTYNLMEEIDSPGEYYIDRDEGILYLYPPENTDLKNAEISVTQVTAPLIWFRSTYDFVIEGISFENTRGTAIMFEGGTQGNRNIVFRNCNFKNLGGKTNQMNGKNNNVGFENCTFTDVNGGVSITGGDFNNLAPGECFVENCSFDNFSRITETYNPAISIYGVGNIARYNTIRNAPHSAIGFYGNDHVIEYNDISDVLTEGSDMAAIYAGKSWKSRGTKIRNNYIHDIKSNISENKEFFGSRTGIYGVYFDDMLCGVEVSGNTFADFGGYGVLINGGRDNIVKNNLFVNTAGSLYVTAIGTEPGKDMSVHYNDLNIVKNNYNTQVWYRRYPELYSIENNEPLLPVDNVFTNNLLVNSGYINIDRAAKPYLLNKDNLTFNVDEATSVGFYDYGNKDYRIDKDAAVFEKIKGFYQLSQDKSGIRRKLQ